MRFINHGIFRWAKEPWFGFHAPAYEPDLIEQLKSVPIRAWDSQEKTWWYPSQFFPIVESCCAGFFVNEMQGGRYLNFLSSAPSVERNTALQTQVKHADAVLERIKTAVRAPNEWMRRVQDVETILREAGI